MTLILVRSFFIMVYYYLSTVNCLSLITLPEQRRFTFINDVNPDIINITTANNEVQPRNLISGVFLGPHFPSRLTASYCICVPAGSCPNPLPPNDGSGQIDVRIVNQPMAPSSTAMPPPVCNYGLTACCQAGAYQCGRHYPAPPKSTAPAEGQAYFGEYPWLAALLTLKDEYLGAGALISDKHVLTAAHKVANLMVSGYKVRLGEWDASNTNEPIPYEDHTIANVLVHPNFNKNNLQNDIALIRLAVPVSLGTRSTVGTACLPSMQTTPAGQRCFVAGWGKNDFGPTGAYQSIQRKVDVPIVSNANCQAALRATRLGMTFELSSSSFICAGGEPRKDACTGDGGSPLVCENNNIWSVVGMVAWGIGCAQAGVPGVYVNVATYLPWIQSMMAA